MGFLKLQVIIDIFVLNILATFSKLMLFNYEYEDETSEMIQYTDYNQEDLPFVLL